MTVPTSAGVESAGRLMLTASHERQVFSSIEFIWSISACWASTIRWASAMPSAFEPVVHLVDLGALGVVDLLGECDHGRVGAVGDHHLGPLDGLFVVRDHFLNQRDVGIVDVVGQVS